MPICEITLVEGRSKEQKRALMKEVTEAISHSLGAPPTAIRIILREIPGEHFAVAGEPKS